MTVARVGLDREKVAAHFQEFADDVAVLVLAIATAAARSYATTEVDELLAKRRSMVADMIERHLDELCAFPEDEG